MPLAARRLSAKQSFWILRSQAELGNESDFSNTSSFVWFLHQTACQIDLLTCLDPIFWLHRFEGFISHLVPKLRLGTPYSEAPLPHTNTEAELRYATLPSGAWEREKKQIKNTNAEGVILSSTMLFHLFRVLYYTPVTSTIIISALPGLHFFMRSLLSLVPKHSSAGLYSGEFGSDSFFSPLSA